MKTQLSISAIVFAVAIYAATATAQYAGGAFADSPGGGGNAGGTLGGTATQDLDLDGYTILDSSGNVVIDDILGVTSFIVAPYLAQSTGDVADAGFIRLANTGSLCAELATPGADSCLTFLVSDRWSFSGASVAIEDNYWLNIGSGTDGLLGHQTGTTPDTTVLAPGTESNAVLIVDRADIPSTVTINGGVAFTNPALVLWGASETDPNAWTSISNGSIDVGTGRLSIPDGITAPYCVSNAADPADDGFIRMGNADKLCWEASSGGIDKCFGMATNTMEIQANIRVPDDVYFFFGSSSDAGILYQHQYSTPDTIQIQPSVETDTVAIVPYGTTTDLSPADENRPTLKVYSSDANTITAPLRWVSISHDQTNGVIDAGSGAVSFPDGIIAGATNPNYASAGAVRLANQGKVCSRGQNATTDWCFSQSGNGAWYWDNSTVSVNVPKDTRLVFGGQLSSGSATPAIMKFVTGSTPDSLQINPPAESNATIFVEYNDSATAFTLNGGVAFPDPTLILGANTLESDPNLMMLMSHDQTNATIRAGKGAVALHPNRMRTSKGGSIDIQMDQQVLTCAGGGGSATLTATNLGPQYSHLLFVGSRIGTALTGATGYTLGDGSDADLFGTAAAATQGTTTGNPTAQWSNPQLAAVSPVVTFTGGNCTSGSVTVTAYYITFTAPTSN